MTRNRYERDHDANDYGSGRRRGGNGGERYRTEDHGYDTTSDARNTLDTRNTPDTRNVGGRDDGRGYERDYTRDYGSENYYGRGAYGERADYREDEHRYGETSGARDVGRDDVRDYGRGNIGRATYEGRERTRGASRSHVRCRDIMTRDVTVALRDTTLQEVARMMRDEDTGVIPVVDRPAAAGGEVAEANSGRARGYNNGKLAGLITDRDIVVRALAEGKDGLTTRAEEMMTTDVHTARPNDRVIEVIRKMGDKQVRRIPVVDEEGNLRGIISMADVALETEDDRELADALEEISSGSSFWSKIFG